MPQIGIANDVSNVAECRELCEDNTTSCAYFTYYGPSSFPFMDDCVFYDSCAILGGNSIDILAIFWAHFSAIF